MSGGPSPRVMEGRSAAVDNRLPMLITQHGVAEPDEETRTKSEPPDEETRTKSEPLPSVRSAL